MLLRTWIENVLSVIYYVEWFSYMFCFPIIFLTFCSKEKHNTKIYSCAVFVEIHYRSWFSEWTTTMITLTLLTIFYCYKLWIVVKIEDLKKIYLNFNMYKFLNNTVIVMRVVHSLKKVSIIIIKCTKGSNVIYLNSNFYDLHKDNCIANILYFLCQNIQFIKKIRLF